MSYETTLETIQSTSTMPSSRHPAKSISSSTIYDPSATTYSDLTVQFPITSSRGNKYILIFFHDPTNAIIAEPIPDKHHNTIIKTFQSIITLLKSHNQPMTHHILDNDSSPELLNMLQSNSITFQHVTPHMHCANADECAIQTYKAHLLSGMALLPTDFPMNLWCRLLHHFTLTLNLLRSSPTSQFTSSYHSLFGPYNFLHHPLAPPGSKIMIHVKPSQCQTWSPRAIPAWYLGPELTHYRCHITFVPSTHNERITDTFEFIQPTPSISTNTPISSLFTTTNTQSSQRVQPSRSTKLPVIIVLHSLLPSLLYLLNTNISFKMTKHLHGPHLLLMNLDDCHMEYLNVI